MRVHAAQKPAGWSRLRRASAQRARKGRRHFRAAAFANALINEVRYRDGTDGSYYPPSRFFAERRLQGLRGRWYLLLRDAGFDPSRLPSCRSRRATATTPPTTGTSCSSRSRTPPPNRLRSIPPPPAAVKRTPEPGTAASAEALRHDHGHRAHRAPPRCSSRSWRAASPRARRCARAGPAVAALSAVGAGRSARSRWSSTKTGARRSNAMRRAAPAAWRRKNRRGGRPVAMSVGGRRAHGAVVACRCFRRVSQVASGTGELGRAVARGACARPAAHRGAPQHRQLIRREPEACLTRRCAEYFSALRCSVLLSAFGSMARRFANGSRRDSLLSTTTSRRTRVPSIDFS